MATTIDSQVQAWVLMSARVPVELYQALQAAAKRHGRSLSAEYREALAKHVSEEPQR
jgi:plasmid stability protein